MNKTFFKSPVQMNTDEKGGFKRISPKRRKIIS